EAVALRVAAGGGGHAAVLAGAPPVGGVAGGEEELPAVGLEDVGPRCALLEVVEGGEAAVGGLVAGGGGGCGRGGLGHLVEHAGDGEEGVALVGGDDGHGGGAARVAHPWPAGGVDGAVGGGDDDEAAFAAGFDEDLLLGLRVGLQFGRSGGPAGELGVGQDGAVVDAVDEVAAAGRGGLEVSGAQPLPQVAEPGRFADVAELAGDALGDGAALELQ